jgi:hypothetical protein
MDAALAALQERALPELASLMDELASWPGTQPDRRRTSH